MQEYHIIEREFSKIMSKKYKEISYENQELKEMMLQACVYVFEIENFADLLLNLLIMKGCDDLKIREFYEAFMSADFKNMERLIDEITR